MLDQLSTDLETLDWKPADDGDLSDIITFDIICSGFESNDDGLYPEYELTIYEKFEDDLVARNKSLQTAVELGLPFVIDRAGNFNIEVEIEDGTAVLTFLNLRDRQ